MKESKTPPKPRSIGLGIMLLICFAILAVMLPRQSPAVPCSGIMPFELWVVGRDQILAARIWIYGIFLGYIVTGITGWLRGSRALCFAVPVAMVAISLLALLRFLGGMNAFSR